MSTAIFLATLAMILSIDMLLLVRNHYTYKARMYALSLAHKYCQEAIEAGFYDYSAYYDIHESYGSYDYMVDDVANMLKFSTDSLYPGLEGRLAAVRKNALDR